ncbi:hypothetical protein PR048_030509 [Dryococelus australis]|uniref:Uncharacterized protein n=1 Tax=Dryococelus australis TaxID=614101 RepID=A0ABQ9G9M8_9NEOP|nr:hypothetical protein PR048_030509 [Dryococelus australis]
MSQTIEQTMVTTSQEDFFNNKINKGHLIAMLKLHLVETGVQVVQTKDDADVLNSYHCTRCTVSGNPSIIVSTNTDFLVMLIYGNRPNGNVKMLHPSTNITSAKLYDIAAIKKDIGDMQSAVLFVHAVTGGDKTSRNVSLHSEVVNIFNSLASHPEEVANTGERFVRALYPGGINLIILMICDYTV